MKAEDAARRAVDRRSFVKAAGLGGAALVVGRLDAGRGLGAVEPATPRLLLHNNENPLGPSPAVLESVRAALRGGQPAARYPARSAGDLQRAIADSLGVTPAHVALGCGSTQVLNAAVQTFTSPARALLAASPSYEECARYARLIGSPVREVPLDAQLRPDLAGMARAAAGAGLVFVNNPNNPTGTLLDADALDVFLGQVHAAAPHATVLLDEAYHDYVTDAAHRSQASRAARDPRLLVTRTFSKAHGLAGFRVGYAVGHPDTIARVAAWEGVSCLNVPGIAAAIASLADRRRLEQERERNREARSFTRAWFGARGHASTDSQCNFVFVDIGRPARGFREACLREGVLVGRDFPPYEQSHVRISIGTLEEMRQAVAVFDRALGAPARAA